MTTSFARLSVELGDLERNLATARTALRLERVTLGDPDKRESKVGHRLQIQVSFSPNCVGFCAIKSHSSISASIAIRELEHLRPFGLIGIETEGLEAVRLESGREGRCCGSTGHCEMQRDGRREREMSSGQVVKNGRHDYRQRGGAISVPTRCVISAIQSVR